MNQKDYLSLPIRYEIQPAIDDRILKVKVFVMHNGLNGNKSNFDENNIEKAKESIKNIPILAFVKKVDGQSQIDFAGHEMEFTIDGESGEIKTTYLGRPIGCIPETNNYHYEIIDGKKYVVVDGVIWRNYANEALEIIERDTEKSVSMEIKVDSSSFKDGYYDIKDYRYTGIAVLGEDVPPAMKNAKIVITNNDSNFSSNFSKMVSEINDYLYSKEVNGLDEVKETVVEEVITEETSTEVTEEVSTTETKVTEEDVVAEEVTVENTAIENESVEQVTEETSNKENIESDKNGNIVIKLSSDAIKETINAEIEEIKAEFAKIQEENSNLKEVIKTYQKEEKLKLVESFGALTDEEKETFKSNIDMYSSATELEEKMLILVGKKSLEMSNFSKKDITHSGVALSEVYTNQHSDVPEWVKLVEQYKSKKNS